MKKRDLIVLSIGVFIIIINLFFLYPKFTGNAVNYIESDKFICSDSDGGKDYFSKGFVEQGGVIKGTDYCTNATRLKEYYCLSRTSTLYDYYDCSYKCLDGACIEKEQAQNTTIKEEPVVEEETNQETPEKEIVDEKELSSLQGIFDKIRKFLRLN